MKSAQHFFSIFHFSQTQQPHAVKCFRSTWDFANFCALMKTVCWSKTIIFVLKGMERLRPRKKGDLKNIRAKHRLHGRIATLEVQRCCISYWLTNLQLVRESMDPGQRPKLLDKTIRWGLAILPGTWANVGCATACGGSQLRPSTLRTPWTGSKDSSTHASASLVDEIFLMPGKGRGRV